jgi:hypothetical protein
MTQHRMTEIGAFLFENIQHPVTQSLPARQMDLIGTPVAALARPQRAGTSSGVKRLEIPISPISPASTSGFSSAPPRS